MNKCMCCKVECGPIGEMDVVSLRQTVTHPRGTWKTWTVMYKMCKKCATKFRATVDGFPETVRSDLDKASALPWKTLSDLGREVLIPSIDRMEGTK